MKAYTANERVNSVFMPCAISNSYNMGCPPVRGDNPRTSASGLSYVKPDNPWYSFLYRLHQCRPCTSRYISC